MTRLTKPNKRDVKKSTPLPGVEETLTPEEETAEDMADLDDMSYRELQALAKRLGLKANGSKLDLIERLTDA